MSIKTNNPHTLVYLPVWLRLYGEGFPGVVILSGPAGSEYLFRDLAHEKGYTQLAAFDAPAIHMSIQEFEEFLKGNGM